jgi:hypothetical protein
VPGSNWHPSPLGFPRPPEDFPVVGIGASVQHLDPTHESMTELDLEHHVPFYRLGQFKPIHTNAPLGRSV